MPDASLAVITGTAIGDASKRPIARGVISFTPVDAFGNAVSFGTPGANVTADPVTRPVVNGAIAGPLSLVRSDMSVPVGINYLIRVTDLHSGEVFTLGLANIAAPAWDLGSFAPSNVQTAPPAAWVIGSGGSGTVGPQGPPGTNAANPNLTFTASTLAPGSAATAATSGTYPNLTVALGIPQGTTGATGPAGSGGGAGTISSVGGLGGFFTSAVDSSGHVTFAYAANPVLAGLTQVNITNPYGYGYALQVGAALSNNSFVVDCISGLFGMYNADSHTYYGFGTSAFPPSNWAVMTAYFSGLGIVGRTANTDTGLFGVSSKSQYIGDQGAGKLALCVTDSNEVFTFNNTLDDGDGNIAAKGFLTLGSNVSSTTASTITAGTGAPSTSPENGSLYLRSDGAAGSTVYVRIAGAWVAIA